MTPKSVPPIYCPDLWLIGQPPLHPHLCQAATSVFSCRKRTLFLSEGGATVHAAADSRSLGPALGASCPSARHPSQQHTGLTPPRPRALQSRLFISSRTITVPTTSFLAWMFTMASWQVCHFNTTQQPMIFFLIPPLF